MSETLTVNSSHKRGSTKWHRRFAFAAAGLIAGATAGAGATASDMHFGRGSIMTIERSNDRSEITADAVCSAAVKRAGHIDSLNTIVANVSALTTTELDTCTDNAFSGADRGFRMGSEESQVSFWNPSLMEANKKAEESDLKTLTLSSDTLPAPMGGFALAGGILALGLSGRRRGQTAA